MCGPQDITNLFWSSIKVDFSDQCFRRSLLEALKKQSFSQFKVEELSIILYSLVKVECEDRDLLSKIHLELKHRNFQHFSCRTISGVIWSFASLRNVMEIDSFIINNLCNEIKARSLKSFNAKDISNMFWGLILLLEPVKAKLIILLLLEELRNRNLSEFKPQDISIFVWGMAKVGINDEVFLVALVADLRHRTLCDFNSQNLVNSFWGLATLISAESDAQQNLLSLVCKEIKNREFREFNPQDISNVLWSLAHLQMFDEIDLQKLIYAEVCNRIKSFSSRDISEILWSMASLRYYHKEVITLFIQQIKVWDFTNKEIANILWSLANFNEGNSATIDFLLSDFQKNITESNAQDFINIVWSLACLDLFQHSQVKELLSKSLPQDMSIPKVGLIAQQLHQAIITWQQVFPYDDMPVLLRDLNKHNWVQSYLKVHRSSAVSSVTHLEISSTLRNMGFSDLRNEYETPHGVLVDILLTKKVVVEVDGPVHFFVNEHRPLGRTLFKRRLLSRFGYRVVSIDVLEWDHQNTKIKKIEYLEMLLQQKE